MLVSYRPEVIAKLGLDFESVSAVNDRIVYGGLTAWGASGPRAKKAGMDLLAQLVGGIMGITGDKVGPPVKAGPPLGAFVASLCMVSGCLLLCEPATATGRVRKLR